MIMMVVTIRRDDFGMPDVRSDHETRTRGIKRHKDLRTCKINPTRVSSVSCSINLSTRRIFILRKHMHYFIITWCPCTWMARKLYCISTCLPHKD